MEAMHIIITVTGTDHVGIIAGVSQALAELEVNIVNVSQTLMGKYFTMIMEGALTDAAPDLSEVQHRLQEAGQRHGVTVRVQSEAIFDAMHTL
jgi:ACT domain-containing protein